MAGPDPDRGDRPVRRVQEGDHHRPAGRADCGRPPFDLVQLGNLCLTRVRQRRVQEHQHRRDRRIGPSWARRTLLLRGYDTPSARARDRLDEVFETDDPTSELTAAWGVKEALRLILASPSLDDARAAKARLHNWVGLADTAKPASCSAAPTGRANTS